MSNLKILTVRGKNDGAGKFDLQDAVFDSLIIAGIAFFSTLSGITIIGVPSADAMVGAAIAAATQFLITLAIKKGIREPHP